MAKQKKDNIAQFALLLKTFKNKSYIGATVGYVENLSPLIISIGEGEIILDNEEDYFLTETVQNLIDRTDNTKLKVDDALLILASEDNQLFFIVDRLKI